MLYKKHCSVMAIPLQFIIFLLTIEYYILPNAYPSSISKGFCAHFLSFYSRIFTIPFKMLPLHEIKKKMPVLLIKSLQQTQGNQSRHSFGIALGMYKELSANGFKSISFEHLQLQKKLEHLGIEMDSSHHFLQNAQFVCIPQLQDFYLLGKKQVQMSSFHPESLQGASTF